MSINPQVQKKMKSKLAELNGQRFRLEQLDLFIYLDCVFREVLRLVSPTLGTVRTLIIDDQLEKVEPIFISFYALARDQRYCSDLYDLNEFHPERYSDDPELHAGGHHVTNTNKSRKIGVTITSD